MLLTHEHRDHTRGAGVLSRRYRLPVYATEGTFAGSDRITGGIGDDLKRVFSAGQSFPIEGVSGVSIETLSTPHDAADPVGYIVEHDGFRLGVFTDFGHPFDELGVRMSTFDAMLLETNYDETMLAEGPYPYVLKQRIAGDRGHLSNIDAAGMLAATGRGRLRRVFLSHLSEENNHPDRVYETIQETLDPDHYHAIDLFLTNRGHPFPMVSLKELSE